MTCKYTYEFNVGEADLWVSKVTGGGFKIWIKVHKSGKEKAF